MIRDIMYPKTSEILNQNQAILSLKVEDKAPSKPMTMATSTSLSIENILDTINSPTTMTSITSLELGRFMY